MSAGQGGVPGEPYDRVVIGAGPAGLSASLLLARYRRRVFTCHLNSPRNVYSHGVRGLLGRHGIPPAELLSRAESAMAAVHIHKRLSCPNRGASDSGA